MLYEQCESCGKEVGGDNYLYAIEIGGIIKRWFCEACWFRNLHTKASYRERHKKVEKYMEIEWVWS